MTSQEFERKFFELVFRTNSKLTPHIIAYRLGLPYQQTKTYLDQMAKDGVVSLEVDLNGVITYEVPGADRPARDWLAEAQRPRVAPVQAQPPAFGQWFSGPAVEEPPRPPEPEMPAVLASPKPSLWLWLPLLLLAFLFLPMVFGLLFFLVSDISGFMLFFLLAVAILKATCSSAACRGARSVRGCSRRFYNLY